MNPLAWLQVLVLAMLAGVLLRQTWLIYFSAAVALIFWVAHQWRLRSLDRVRYQRRFHYTRGFPGETTQVRIVVENNKLLPLSWLRSSDTWPFAVGPQDEQILSPSHIPDIGYMTNLYSLRWRERIARSYTLLLRRRGIYEIGPLALESGDLFGMYEQRQERDVIEYLTVFPALAPLDSLHQRAEDPFGDRAARRPLFEDPSRPMGVRPYHPEDGFRRIHWAATARTGALQSRVYQPVSARTMVIYLNVITEAHFWLGYSPEVLEYMVQICATLAVQGIEDGYAVGLFSNGCLAHADQPFRIQPGRSHNQLAVLLSALAGVTPYVTGQFEPFLLRSMAQIPYGATLVIVTAQAPPALQEVLLRLRRYRAAITLFSFAQEAPPFLPGIRTLHLPFQPAPPAGRGRTAAGRSGEQQE